MRSATTTFVLAAVIFISACVPSLNPLYTEQDLVFEPALIGTWVDKETRETWALSKRGKLDYALAHTDSDGRTSAFIARLVKLEDNMFLDLVPVEPTSAQKHFYKGQYVATHTFVRIAVSGSTVQVSYLEPRWLKDYVAQNPSAVRHERIAGEVVLTSSPKETQKFLLAHLTTREAFSQPSEMTLKRGAQ